MGGSSVGCVRHFSLCDTAPAVHLSGLSRTTLPLPWRQPSGWQPPPWRRRRGRRPPACVLGWSWTSCRSRPAPGVPVASALCLRQRFFFRIGDPRGRRIPRGRVGSPWRGEAFLYFRHKPPKNFGPKNSLPKSGPPEPPPPVPTPLPGAKLRQGWVAGSSSCSTESPPIFLFVIAILFFLPLFHMGCCLPMPVLILRGCLCHPCLSLCVEFVSRPPLSLSHIGAIRDGEWIAGSGGDHECHSWEFQQRQFEWELLLASCFSGGPL